MSPLHNCAGDVSKKIMEDMGNENYPIAEHLLSPQIPCPQDHSDHINWFSTCVLSYSPRPLRAIPPGDISDGFYSNSPLEWFDSSHSTANSNSKVSRCTLDVTNSNATNNFSKPLCPIEDDGLVPLIRYTAQGIEEESSNMSKNGENVILVRKQASTKQESDADCLNAVEPLLALTLPSGEARARSRINDKLRRAKISQGIKALRNCVPCSDKGNKESVLDDVIDYVKFLKLQLQVLSQSRLNGEDTAYPFVYLEGYGHYLLHQQTSKEPLEEIMGQLMESNIQAANELLGNKGLALLPMDYAYTLLQTNFDA